MKFHNIEPNNIENGTGIRVLLWVSGCFHNCEECQNPITHNPNDGVEFDESSMEEIIEYLKPTWISGITFTGGDPLCFYYEETLDIIKKIRKEFGDSKTIWIYTGYTISQLIDIALDKDLGNKSTIFLDILKDVDVICDGKWVKSLESKEYHWVGSINQRVIDMKKSLKKGSLVFLEEEQRGRCGVSSLKADEKIAELTHKIKYRLI